MDFRGPLIIGKGQKAPDSLNVSLLVRARRGGRALYISERTIYLWTPSGWIRVPAGYVTDFGSIPRIVTLLTLMRYDPLGIGLLGPLGHDWQFAVGVEGEQKRADDYLKYRLEVDGVDTFDRTVIYQAVRNFGGGGYRKAKTWWETENFADVDTGQYPVTPIFAREEAFDGGRWGLRPEPNWQEIA